MRALHILDYLVHDSQGFSRLVEGLGNASGLAIEHCNDSRLDTVVYSLTTQECMVYTYDNKLNRAKIKCNE